MKWSSFFCLNMYLNKHLTSSRVRAFEICMEIYIFKTRFRIF
jgi:hypothetical protein